MPQQDTADVAIVGGGVVGSGVAYALMQAPSPPKRVVIIERDTSYREASTPRSAGGVRQQFSTPENILMSQQTLKLIANLKQQFGPDADLSWREQGYLILASAEGRDVLEGNVEVQRRMGADIRLMEPAALAQRFEWLKTDGVVAGSFGASGEGWIDPVALMTLLRRAAVDKGAEIICDTVAGIETSGGGVEALRMASGRKIATGTVVNAAGAWSGALARMAGVALPVEPRKRYVYVVDCREASEAFRRGPLTVDPSGVWLRPEGRTFICGVSPSEADEPVAEDLDTIDYRPFEEVVWPTLAARVPVLESVKLINAWAGYYDYNTLDQNGIIGRHPELRNLIAASGFSGHGLQQGYAAGQAVAELILDGKFTSIDLTRFGWERAIEGKPLLELNVI